MRWPSCERPDDPCAAANRLDRPWRRSTFIVLAMLALSAACVSTVTRYYVPDDHNPRFDADRAAAVLGQYLRVQCPQRHAAGAPDSGVVRITIEADTSGAVRRAELLSSTGDEMLDGVFGTVAAQLQLDSLRSAGKRHATRNLRVGYHCAPDDAAATLTLVQP